MQGNCNSNNSYGYKDGRPCVLIKLNRIIGWKPKPFEEDSLLPPDLPEHLEEEIKKNKEDKDRVKLVRERGGDQSRKYVDSDKFVRSLKRQLTGLSL